MGMRGMGVKIARTAIVAVLLLAAAGIVFADSVAVRPNAVGSYLTNTADNPQNSYDNNTGTYAELEPGERLVVRSRSQSGLGTITAVKIEGLIGTASGGSGANYNIYWMSNASTRGSSHTFAGVKGSDVSASYDVTGERTWSWGDFGSIELVLNRTGGNSDGRAREVWFNITYTTAPVPWVSTDKGTYSGCGTVYYKVTTANESGNVDMNMSVKVIDPLAVVRSQLAAVTGNGGVGVYLGSYALPSGAAAGAWTIRTITCGSIGSGQFTVSS